MSRLWSKKNNKEPKNLECQHLYSKRYQLPKVKRQSPKAPLSFQNTALSYGIGYLHVSLRGLTQDNLRKTALSTVKGSIVSHSKRPRLQVLSNRRLQPWLWLWLRKSKQKKNTRCQQQGHYLFPQWPIYFIWDKPSL